MRTYQSLARTGRSRVKEARRRLGGRVPKEPGLNVTRSPRLGRRNTLRVGTALNSLVPESGQPRL